MITAHLNRLQKYGKQHKAMLCLIILFLFHIFFRFYGFETKHGFEWDQVDNAWAAKNIIVEHKFPLVGMVAKQNSGFYIGPLYYYFVAIFYYLTRLDPIASVIIAGFSSIVSFFVLYFFTKKLFSEGVALVAVFIHTFSLFVIASDRVQWPINFLAPISIVIFYFLYQVILGKAKYIIFLAIALGLSWQLNFTAIFFFLIALLALPFFPRTKAALQYILISFPVMLLFFLPNVIYDLQNKNTSSKHLSLYLNEYYHGFHLTRILQLAKDAFIEFAAIFDTPFLKPLRYFFIPVFFLLYLGKLRTRKKLLFCYLVLLWFLVPWIVFSVYKGEISNYYFSLTRPITLMLLGFITVWVYQRRFILFKFSVVLFWGAFAFVNIREFFVPTYRPLSTHRKNVEDKIRIGEKIEFSHASPESYIYYVYTQKNKSREMKR